MKPRPWLFMLLAIPGFAALSDPPLLSYSTYLSGTKGSGARGLAVDSAGNAYVSGTALSFDFPVTLSSLGPDSPSSACNFVTKLNPSGSGIVWSICLNVSAGGPIAIDSSGSVYVFGSSGGSSAVTKLTPAGDRILYSTVIAGAKAANGIAVDSAGNAYVTGTAGAGLATTPGAYQGQLMAGTCTSGSEPPFPCDDAFVVKLNPAGAIQYGTYIGVSGTANAIALDSERNVWLTGSTEQISQNFAVKLDAAGASLLFKKVFGGGFADHVLIQDSGRAIAVDSEDSAYVVGTTGSVIPTTEPSLLSSEKTQAIYYAGYILKFNSTGGIVYGTEVGAQNSAISTVAVDAAGNAYLGLSSDSGFPIPYQGTSLIVLSPDGSKIAAAAPNFRSGVQLLALDGNGGAYMAGYTNTIAALTTPNAFQTEYAGGPDNAFIAKYDFSQTAGGVGLTCLANAASFTAFGGNCFNLAPSAVAPGEIVTLYTHGLSPSPAPGVAFDGVTAPVLYADAHQINVVVPFEVGPPGNHTALSIQSGTQAIGPVSLLVVDAAPALFTASGDGLGPAAALNQDGSVNSSANPAAPSSVVSLYLTGLGLFDQSLPDWVAGTASASISCAGSRRDSLREWDGRSDYLCRTGARANSWSRSAKRARSRWRAIGPGHDFPKSRKSRRHGSIRGSLVTARRVIHFLNGIVRHATQASPIGCYAGIQRRIDGCDDSHRASQQISLRGRHRSHCR
ncbi:MAG: SBBP repeat-containing protein [Bryobacteraceae bacterium]